MPVELSHNACQSVVDHEVNDKTFVREVSQFEA